MSNPFYADLHAHTTASDGCLSPAALAARAMQAGITCLAITDHDTTQGVEEAKKAAAGNGLSVLTGAELSAGPDGETHVLGYGTDPHNPHLTALFDKMYDERIERAREMAQKLRALGMEIPIEEIVQNARGSVGRPHIARALVRAGYIQSTEEAFERLIGAGMPAYVPRKRLDVTRAIQILKRAGFVPVLAHPALMHVDEQTFYALLNAWTEAGLMGLEAYHPSNEKERGYDFYVRAARGRGLLVTGGSDYHDDGGHHARLGETAMAWVSAKEDVDALKSAIEAAQ